MPRRPVPGCDGRELDRATLELPNVTLRGVFHLYYRGELAGEHVRLTTLLNLFGLLT